MAAVIDLLGRPIEKGDDIILKAIEAYNFRVLDMGELTIVRVPGQPHGVRQVKLFTELTLNIPDVSAAIQVAAYIVKKHDPPKPILQ